MTMTAATAMMIMEWPLPEDFVEGDAVRTRGASAGDEESTAMA